MTACSVTRISKDAMLRLLREKPEFAEGFLSYVLQRNARIEEDLVDQLLNSSEKRLARALLLLTQFGKDGPSEPIPPVSQEMLAQIIGTTRGRVSFFMNKFRKLGFIEYNGGLKIHSSLLSVLLRD
jgi:CRP/FNR family transcriptional regulator, cyclic AMP receptor protein